ncbi:hypothetical protein ACVW0P_004065 [Mucilaginibacter sp. UYNi724]
MKKYILKPGRHQFAPGSAAVHSSDNLTDEEAEWYLQRYPHIAGLFIESPEEEKPRKRRARRLIGAPITKSITH